MVGEVMKVVLEVVLVIMVVGLLAKSDSKFADATNEQTLTTSATALIPLASFWRASSAKAT